MPLQPRQDDHDLAIYGNLFSYKIHRVRAKRADDLTDYAEFSPYSAPEEARHHENDIEDQPHEEEEHEERKRESKLHDVSELAVYGNLFSYKTKDVPPKRADDLTDYAEFSPYSAPEEARHHENDIVEEHREDQHRRRRFSGFFCRNK